MFLERNMLKISSKQEVIDRYIKENEIWRLEKL